MPKTLVQSCFQALLGAAVVSSAACASRRVAKDDAAPSAVVKAPPSAAPSAFDEDRVRDDLFAALDGDAAALLRAERTCDEELRVRPGNAEALVQHGIAMSIRSWGAYRTGNVRSGQDFWNRAQSEMDRAVALSPDDLGVRIPRGSALFGIAGGMGNTALAKECLTKAVDDYEATLRIQGAAFDQRAVHDRAELLWGLAEGWRRLGDETRAKEYFERLVEQCSSSPLAPIAKRRLAGDVEAPRPSCKGGCHS